MKYISWNKITKVSLTGLLICGATLCEKAQAEENNNYSGVTENLINTTVDVDPPEFVSLTSDKTEVRSGERVNYTLKAHDKGKLTTASIVLKNDENGKTKTLYSDAPTSDGTYSFTLEVDEKLSSGIWRLNEIILRDDSDNYLDIYGKDALALYSTPLKVNNNVTVDVDPPEFVSLTSDKTEVRSGERVNYTLKAHDKGKLTTASIVLKNDENGKTKTLYSDAPTSDGTYSFTLEVDEKLSSGIWRLNEIILRDDSDNYLDIYGKDALALYSTPLKVNNNVTVDVDPPEFVSLTSDKTEVRSGERVNYTLKAHDKGKLTTASIVLKNDENGKTKTLYSDAPTSDGTYSFTLEVDEKLSSGIWRLNEIILRDDSDNYLDIYGKDALALYSKPLKVGESSLNNISNNLQPDTEVPKLISIKLNQTNATEHDVVTYTVEASDNRQLDLAYLTIRSVSSPFKYETLSGKLNKEGQLIFRYQVDENSFPGDWQISSLAIYDKAKNISEYNSENLPKESSPILTISTNLQPDTEAPKLISIKLNQTNATEHDVVTYTVEASDNRQLDLAYLTIRSVSSPFKYETLSGKLNKEGQLIFRYQVDENSFPGDWQISSLAIYDKAKNISEYNSENLPKESSPILTISNNLQPDIEAPKLISIKLNQISATKHDVVTYTVEASDNRQLDSAYLTIRSVSSPSKYETLTGNLNKEGQLIFRYQVDENTFPGDWQISSLTIYDKAKNISEYNSENIPKESSPILRVANRREISSLDTINIEKESTLSIHGINNVEKSKNDANVLPTNSLSNNQPIDESVTAVQSTDKSDSENSTAVQSPDKTSNENINTSQSPDKTSNENINTSQSPDKTDSGNSTAAQSPDKSDNENSTTVQSPDKNNSESINMELYVQDALQNNGFSPYGEGNLFENANSDMIEKNNELKIHQYPKRIERNLPKTGNKLFSVLSILGAINLLLILLRILMKTL